MNRTSTALEAPVQKAICEYLDHRQIPYAVTNVAPRGFSRRRTRKKESGWPDITACVNGRFVGIECKREKGGKVRDSQVDKHAELREAGAFIVIAKSVDEVIGALAGL